MTLRIVVLSVASLAMSACAGPRVVRDGFTLGQRTWEANEKELGSRAAYELGCPRDSLVLTVLGEELDGFASQVGVDGCGKRIMYLRQWMQGLNGSKWVASSITEHPANP